MKDDLPISDSERKMGLTWLRDVLTSALEVSPVSYQQKRKTARLLQRISDWFMASWAGSLNIDYIGGCAKYPDMAEKANSDTGSQLAQQYLEAHDAVPTGFCLDQLCRRVIKLAQGDRLPVDTDLVERQVCALALSECTEDGIEFAKKAREVLSDPENPNHILVDYQIVLERGDKKKLEKLDAILTDGRYGEWITERLNEMKRWLRGGVELNIHWEIGTLPDSRGIYQFLLKGGKKNES